MLTQHARQGFFMTDALIACIISLGMISAAIGIVASMKTKLCVTHTSKQSEEVTHTTLLARLSPAYRMKGLSDEFTTTLACVCARDLSGNEYVCFRERQS